MLRSEFLARAGAAAISPRALRAVPAGDQPTGPTVAIVNRSTVASDNDVAHAAAALRTQVTRDFGPAWHTSATVYATQQPTPTDWLLTVADDSPVSYVFGYHQWPGGVPRGYVFARTDAKAGLDWRITLSHELLEMLADPWVGTAYQVTDDEVAVFEVCDPVQADRDGYLIGDVPVSNFVLPAWYTGDVGPYDFRGLCSAPLEIRHGGYLSFASMGPWRARGSQARAGSGRMRRAA